MSTGALAHALIPQKSARARWAMHGHTYLSHQGNAQVDRGLDDKRHRHLLSGHS